MLLLLMFVISPCCSLSSFMSRSTRVYWMATAEATVPSKSNQVKHQNTHEKMLGKKKKSTKCTIKHNNTKKKCMKTCEGSKDWRLLQNILNCVKNNNRRKTLSPLLCILNKVEKKLRAMTEWIQFFTFFPFTHCRCCCFSSYSSFANASLQFDVAGTFFLHFFSHSHSSFCCCLPD